MSTTTAPTGCMPWCRTDIPDNHRIDECGELHSRVLATGAESKNLGNYGPTYEVWLEYGDETRLWVDVAVRTLTADQAEVLGRALLEGAAALRASGDTVAKVNVCAGYLGWPTGWVRVPRTVFDPTPAEQEVGREAAR